MSIDDLKTSVERVIALGELDEARGLVLGAIEAALSDAATADLSRLFGPELRAELELLFPSAASQFELLELQAMAPEEAGLRELALRRIEDLGHANARDAALSRDVERTLHAFGVSAAAYRVERSRKATTAGSPRARAGKRDRDLPLAGLTIALIGGFPALRSLIRTDLSRAGAREVRELPSDWEGVRAGRDVASMLGGVDLVVLLRRQVSHSTSDLVRTSAARLKVPVLAVESLGISGVRRAVEAFAAALPA